MGQADEPACLTHGTTLLLAAGELPATACLAAARHLGACAACRDSLAALDAVQTAYAATTPAVPPTLFEVVIARIAAKGGAPPRRWRVGPIPPSIAWAAALALGAGLFGAGVYAGRGNSAADPAPPADEGGVTALALSRLELRSEVWTERLRGAHRLGALKMEAEGTVTDLLAAVLTSDPNPNVRLAALDALRSRVLAARSRAMLERLLFEEPVAVLRMELVDVVAAQGGADVAELLRRLLAAERDPAVRRRAELALRRIS